MRRLAVITTSYPAYQGDPSGHFVETDAVARTVGEGSGDDVTVITPLESSREDGRLHVLGLRGGAAFGWPGVIPRLAEDPSRVLSALRWIARARNALARLSPFDSIIAHFCVPCAYPIALEPALGGELEVISHGTDVRVLGNLPAPLRCAIVRAIGRRAHAWKFVSTHLLSDLLGTLPRRERSIVERIACVEAARIEFPDVRERTAQLKAEFSGRRLLVCVGRLISSKGIERAILHAEIIQRHDPSSVLVIVGDGPESAPLKRMTRRRNVRVVFTGRVPRPEALAWVGAADTLLFSSKVEGFPTILREAHVLNVPVIHV